MKRLRKTPRSYSTATLLFEKKSIPLSIKIKGHRSFQPIGKKPALKLRFPKEHRFFGRKFLVLNNMVDDPTRMREHLGYELFRAAGLMAPQTSFVHLFLNEKDLGIYLAIEPINKEFVKRRFGTPLGGLYEGEYGCDIYQEDAKRFARIAGPKNSRASLKRLANVAANTPQKLWGPKSPYLKNADVINFLAVSTALADFDGYWHSHNYFLYENGPGGPWSLLPWGIDRAFHDRVPIFASQGRLAQLCFADNTCREVYAKRLLEVAQLMTELHFETRMLTLSRMLGRSFSRVDTTSLKQRQRKRLRMRNFLKERPAKLREKLRCLQEDDQDHDGYRCGDCNPTNAQIHPGATEICDAIDNDCNGRIDDAPDCSCKAHTIGKHTFHLCNLPMPWKDARDFCLAKGMHLGHPNSNTESDALFVLLHKKRVARWWLGASDRKQEGAWEWSYGAPMTYKHWRKSQPNDVHCGQDCLATEDFGHGEWADAHCEQHLPFVCQE